MLITRTVCYTRHITTNNTYTFWLSHV